MFNKCKGNSCYFNVLKTLWSVLKNQSTTPLVQKMLDLICVQKHDRSYFRSELCSNDTVKNSQSDVCSLSVSIIWGRMWSTACYIVASHLQRLAPATTQHLTQEDSLHKTKKPWCKIHRVAIKMHKEGAMKIMFICVHVCVSKAVQLEPKYSIDTKIPAIEM